VLGVCIIAIIIGATEDLIVAPENRIITLAEQYEGFQLKFLMFPNISMRKMTTMLTSGQFYLDALSMSIVILLETMITLGMMGISTDQSYTSQSRNIMTLVFSNMTCLLTGSMASCFVYARSYLNHQTGAKNQWSCVMNGFICLAVGFLLFRLFAYLPSVALEAILMGLELKTIRIKEMLFTFKHDKKLFITNMTVMFTMLFTRPSNAILTGLFCYLAMLAKELMMPQNEITYSKIRTLKLADNNQTKNLSKSSKKCFPELFIPNFFENINQYFSRQIEGH
jgi:MFS superfamily sulfate permease-like transporter